METNTCDINHSDADDALLPPHKCLLAGLKKHVPEAHSPAPLTSCGANYNDYNIRLNNFLQAHLSNHNLSNKEIAEASKCAAIKASEIAEAKRAVAEQKAATAAEAMAAANSALELVATIEDEAAIKDKRLKKNKTKKHVHVQELLEIAEAKRAVAEQKVAKAAKAMAAAKSALELVATIEDGAAKKHVHVQELYDTDNGGNSNCDADEEMALNLHQAINSSPRMLKSPTGQKREEMKVDTEGYVKEIEKVVLGNGNGKMSRVSLEKDGFSEPLNCLSKENGRIKQEKLLLSACSFRDQTSPNDEVKSCVETSGNGLMMPVETWKCQEVRAPACVSQNKATGQRTRGSNAKVPENESKEYIESVGKAGLRRTRNSRKEEIIDEPLIDSSVIEGKGTRKLREGEKIEPWRRV